jgi:hypothetical protein
MMMIEMIMMISMTMIIMMISMTMMIVMILGIQEWANLCDKDRK